MKDEGGYSAFILQPCSIVEPDAGAVIQEDSNDSSAKPLAVIDMGTTSIRMTIAQIDETGKIHILENLDQAVNLGKDTFTKGYVQKETVEECVGAVKGFQRILAEYRISESDRIRAVATSAVREASNRDAVLDRIYIGTGIEFEAIDEPEANRLTYQSVQPLLESEPAFAKSDTLIVELGGGSTELLLVRDNNVVFSRSFRLGSLRMREMLETFRAPEDHFRDIIESNIQRTIDQVSASVPIEKSVEMIALSREMIFAASELLPDWNPTLLAKLPISSLAPFAEKILGSNVDDIVLEHHLTYQDSETIGPALLAYVMLARAFEMDRVFVTNVGMREGILKEMAAHGTWTEEFRSQMIRSALDLGSKFRIDESHAHHVAELCKTLFGELQEEHRLPPRYELLLIISALLHEIGAYVSDRSRHKHSMYLIVNSELFGLGKKDRQLVALVARYHRRASPKPTHDSYSSLERKSRVAVAKMAAILRVADALDRSRSQRVRKIQCCREDGELVILVSEVEDLTLERMALNEKGSMFEEVYGMKVSLRRKPTGVVRTE